MRLTERTQGGKTEGRKVGCLGKQKAVQPSIMKFYYSKVAGPSVSSPDPTPGSEISLRREKWFLLVRSGTLQGEPEHSQTFLKGSPGRGLTRFWLKNPGALTWGIFQIPVQYSMELAPFKHLPPNPVTSKGGRVTAWATLVPSRVSMLFNQR